MSRKPASRLRRTHVRRRQRRGRPYFLLGVVFAFAALVGVQQFGAFQRHLIAALPPAAADDQLIQVETIQLESGFAEGEPARASTSDETLMPLRPLSPALESMGVRWAGPDPAPFEVDSALATRVTQRIAGRSGRYGIAIKNLRTGQGVLIDPHGHYEAASLFKLSVMYEVFKQRHDGNLSLGEMLRYTQRHIDYDLGTNNRAVGTTIMIAEALERMITISDNSAAILLTDRVGPGNITRDLTNLGLTQTRLLQDDLSTSPGDMLLLLETIARGEAVSREASAEMIHLLTRQRVNDRIPRLLPPGTIVAHKTGNLPGVVNDVGIVYGGDQIFVVAVLVDGTSNDGEAARITAELSALAYEHFHATAARDGITLRTMGEIVPTSAPWPTPLPTPTEAPRPIASSTPTTDPSTPTEMPVSTRVPTSSTPVTPITGVATTPTLQNLVATPSQPAGTATGLLRAPDEPVATPATIQTAVPAPATLDRTQPERRIVPGVIQVTPGP